MTYLKKSVRTAVGNSHPIASQANASDLPKDHENVSALVKFENLPPQGVAQRRYQEMADKSAQVSHLAQLQAAADSAHAPGSLQRKENRTGMPDGLKSGIENLSGLSMDDVRVNYNSSKPTAFQAHAYAQGTEIHVAPGQERHLPHEAWHVVQQKQGRVKPTMQMKGMNINGDPGLEQEADVMGAKAFQLASDRSSSDTDNFKPLPFVKADGDRTSAGQNDTPIQRKIGFEFETGNSVLAEPKDKVFRSPAFDIDADSESPDQDGAEDEKSWRNIEFVTHPQESLEAAANAINAAAAMAKQIGESKGYKKETAKVAETRETINNLNSAPTNSETDTTDMPVEGQSSAAEASSSTTTTTRRHKRKNKQPKEKKTGLGIDPDRLRVTDPTWAASVQYTEGVPLEELGKYLKSNLVSSDMKGDDDYVNFQPVLTDADDSPHAGMAKLVAWYIQRLRSWKPSADTDEGPKNATVIMSRSDFHSMYDAIKRAGNREHYETKIKNYLKLLNVNLEQKLIPAPHKDSAGNKFSNPLTVQQWLDSIKEAKEFEIEVRKGEDDWEKRTQKEKDQLSPPMGFREVDPRYSMGAMGTDGELAVLESRFRNGWQGKTVDEWIGCLYEIIAEIDRSKRAPLPEK